MTSIRFAVGFSVSRQILNAALALATLPIITSSVGAEGFAQVVGIQVGAQLLALLVSGSVPAYLTHEIAKLVGGQGGSGRASSNEYAWVLSVGAPLLLVVAALFEGGVPESAAATSIALALVLAATTLVNEFVTAVLVGNQRFIASDAVAIATSVITFGGVWFARESLTPAVTIMVYVASVAVAVVIRVALLWRCKDLGYLVPRAGTPLRLYRDASPLLFANVAGLLVYRLHYLIVSVVASPAMLGTFALAQQVAEKAWIPAQAVASVLFPKLSTLSRHERAKSARHIHVAAGGAAALAVAGVVIVSLVPEQLAARLFGSEFHGLPYLLASMSLGIGAWAAVKAYAAVVASAGAFHLNLWAALITVFFTALGIGGAALFGETYLGWGLSVGYVFGFCFQLKFFRSLL